jgi:hypothetical protein
VRYQPGYDLGSVCLVSAGQGHAATALAAGLDAVQPGSVPVRHGEMVGRG